MDFSKIILAIVLISTTTFAKVELPEKEQDAIHTLRQVLLMSEVPFHAYQLEDSYLLRFLKAKNMDFIDALNLIQETQNWRTENNMDAILNETISVMPEAVRSTSGIDIQGHPIITISMKDLNLRKIILAGQTSKFYRYNFQLLEKLEKRTRLISEISGEDVHQIYSIIDFAGYNSKQHKCADCIKTLVKWYTDALKYYPGLIYGEVWINTPKTAEPLVAAILEVFKNANVPDTFIVFDGNRKEWSEFLHMSIEDQELTFQFGGSRQEHTFENAIEK